MLAPRSAVTPRGAYEPFFAGFLEFCDTAVVLSGDPAEGPVIGGVRPRRLPAGRGQFVSQGEPAGEIQGAWLAPDDGHESGQAAAPKRIYAAIHHGAV